MNVFDVMVAYLKAEFNKGRNKGIEHREKITQIITKENKEVK